MKVKPIKGTLKQLCEGPPPLPSRAKGPAVAAKPAGSNTDWSWMDEPEKTEQNSGNMAGVSNNAVLAASVAQKVVAAAQKGDMGEIKKQLATLEFYVNAIKKSF